MNSAAYYLGSQASRVYATDSAQVGSVGVILVHTDESRKDEMEGVKNTFITAGKFKAELAGPLTDESRGHLQSHVDALYDDFVSDVALGRGTDSENVRENYGQGRVLLPKDAEKVGMIDGIRTFDSVLGRLIESGGDIRALDTSSPVPVTAQATSIPMYFTADNTAGNASTTVFRFADIDKEHSEPGTGQGGEPTPREAPETGDKAIEGGWRRDPPPIAYELQEEEMDRQWLEARATALGIEFSDEVTDEQLQEVIARRVDDVVAPMAVATAEADKQREFLKDYPEQAALLAQLQAHNRASEAHEFAESYQTFTEDSKRGFSNVVREKIEQSHLKIAERTFSHDDLKDLLDSTTSKTSIVTFGEAGSARTGNGESAAPGSTVQETRKMVADLVRTAMTDDGLDRNAAMDHVANQHPDLWAAYVENK
jgi:ClpP class serine protease